MIFLDVRPPQSAEDRRETAVAHLALARSLNCRNRHFGYIFLSNLKNRSDRIHMEDRAAEGVDKWNRKK